MLGPWKGRQFIVGPLRFQYLILFLDGHERLCMQRVYKSLVHFQNGFMVQCAFLNQVNSARLVFLHTVDEFGKHLVQVGHAVGHATNV